MSGYEFRVWSEDGDLVWSGDSAGQAVVERDAARVRCAESGCGNGNPEISEDPEYRTTCGVGEPHGISVQICLDGVDMTGHVYEFAGLGL